MVLPNHRQAIDPYSNTSSIRQIYVRRQQNHVDHEYNF